LTILELTGLEAGKARLNPEHNLIFRNVEIVDQPERLAKAKILLPMPYRVHTPRRYPMPSSQFRDTTDLPKDYRGNLGTLQVFTYTFPSDAGLRLSGTGGGHYWEPAFTSDGSRTINLHLFAEPDRRLALDHGLDAFAVCMALLGGLRVQIGKSSTPSTLFENELPVGVRTEECEDLNERLPRLARLGRMRKQERDLNHVWFPAEAFDAPGGACTGPALDDLPEDLG
jgi:hypothetical protein